jgi:hypothetical protein
MWNAHVRDGSDRHQLSALDSDPSLFEELTAEMRAAGVGNGAQRESRQSLLSIEAADL